MLALASALLLIVVFFAVAYGRAIVYARSEEYKLDQRIKAVTKS
jgi:hypothetical protein